MIVAVATWTPSVSDDVVHQSLSWLVNGDVVTSVDLKPDTNTRSSNQDNVQIKEGDEVCFEVVAKDEVSASEAATGCASVPTVPPEAPTGAVLEIIEGN